MVVCRGGFHWLCYNGLVKSNPSLLVFLANMAMEMELIAVIGGFQIKCGLCDISLMRC